MNVLSLFDGMSCAQIALNRAGIKYDKYFSSEIDKYAIAVTHNNYPNTIQLGDVRNIILSKNIKIDLIIGGSPCQGFSFSGKQLNFNDPRSKLFFEYVRLVKELNPKWFILENVLMKEEYQDVISKELGVYPVMINSALVSAQNRKRLYWCNFHIDQPKDKGILLKDILENGIVDRNKAHCIDASYYKNVTEDYYRTKSRRQIVYCKQVGIADIKGNENIKRVYSTEGKSPTLTTCQGGNQDPKIAISDKHYRKLTPVECERLQTVPDNYTEGVSNTQRYKMLGNGFTVDIIAHILKCRNNPLKKIYEEQLTFW